MNTVEYLKKKEQSAAKMATQGHRTICQSCLRPIKACFCEHLIPFQTDSKICILMHPLEAKRSQIGTGRLTHLGISNSELIIDINFDHNKRFNELLANDDYLPVVLYPGKDAINIDCMQTCLLYTSPSPRD